MSEDYDYEFHYESRIDRYCITRIKKESNKTFMQFQNEDSIFHLPDYTKIVPDKLINNMKKNKDIQSVKSYLEVNDLYLLNAPEESENPYVSTYMNDRILDDRIAKQFSISNNTRGIQFLVFQNQSWKR